LSRQVPALWPTAFPARNGKKRSTRPWVCSRPWKLPKPSCNDQDAGSASPGIPGPSLNGLLPDDLALAIDFHHAPAIALTYQRMAAGKPGSAYGIGQGTFPDRF